MKIAIDCHTLELKNWAGKEQLLFDLLENLKLLDKENEYCLYSRHSIFSIDLFPANWTAKVIKLPPFFWQLGVLIHCLFVSPADLLFTPSTYLLPAIKIKIPTVVMVHDLAVFIPEIKKTHKFSTRLKERLFLRLALKKARAIAAVSENTKKDIVEYLHLDPEKIFVAYPGVRSLFQSQLNPSGPTVPILPSQFILALGTLEPRKNVVNIIRAYYLEKDLLPPLIIVGKKGWYYQEIFSLAEELKLIDKIIFAGYLPDEQLPYIYRNASCLVYPSLYEGFGLPVLEALFCNCPVVTSNISSLPEVAGQAAILVNPYSVEEIAAAMKKLVVDEGVASELRSKGAKQAQKFSSDNFAYSLLKIFKTIKK